MKSICFCNSAIPWGGGEKWHYTAARSFAARGWRVLLICHPEGVLYERAAQLEGVERVPFALGRLSFLNPLTCLRLRRFFRREAVHALVVNLPADLKAAAPAAKSAGVRHVVYRRGSALPVRDTWLNRYLLGKVITGFIANSEATKARALVNNPSIIDPKRISVLYNGIDVAAFDADLARAADRGEVFFPPTQSGRRPFVIGNAGRLHRQKGQHLLLYLGRRLLDAGLDCRILVAGAGERETELKNLAADLGLGDKALFCGFLPDLAPFWRSIDLFALTSLWEGFGNVLLEAMLARKPVFAFAVSNLPELVRDGPEGNGKLFPLPDEELFRCRVKGRAGEEERVIPAVFAGSGDEREKRDGLTMMAEAVLVLSRDPEKMRRMGLAGRAFAQRFSLQASMDELEALLPYGHNL
ncbi:MAG: glycosyltransferase [Desulfovibrio sp.]|jgi:glycosyltransferase involved in cell wall biosynthesis|nr:glycosyltransferase [Desulfovibrio sp.]